MSNPNRCDTCEHKPNGDGGWCYMFRDEPQSACLQHSERSFGNFISKSQLKKLVADQALQDSLDDLNKTERWELWL